MRISKKFLSLCLMLSIICTSLVFTGGGTVLAAAPTSLDGLVEIDEIVWSSGYKSWYGSGTEYDKFTKDSVYIDFDVTPSTFDTEKFLRLRTSQSDKKDHILRIKPDGEMRFIDSETKADLGKAFYIDSSKKTHITIRYYLMNFSKPRLYVFANGKDITHLTNNESNGFFDSNKLFPQANNTIYAIKNEPAFENLSGHLQKHNGTTSSINSSYMANFTSTSDDVIVAGTGLHNLYDYTITCDEGTSYEALIAKLNMGDATIKSKSIADETALDDGDTITLKAAKGSLTNTYTIVISRPVLFNLPQSVEYGDFNKIEATLSDDVGTVTSDGVQLFFNGTEDTSAVCTVSGKKITITNFKPPVGAVNVKIKVTDESDAAYDTTKSTTVTLSNPLTLNIPSAADYDKLKTITAKLSSYFDADYINYAKLYFDNTEQTEANWSVQDDVLTFTNVSPSLGSVNIKAEISYADDPEPYSDTVAAKIVKYEISGESATPGWKYYDYAGKAGIQPEDDPNFTYTFGSSWSDFTNKTGGSISRTAEFVIGAKDDKGNIISLAPNKDEGERIYKISFPFKLHGDTALTPSFTFGTNKLISFVKISSDNGGTSYKATYGADGVLADDLAPDKSYTLEAVINHDMCIADYTIVGEDNTKYSVNDVSIDDSIASLDLKKYSLKLDFGAGAGPLSIGKSEIFYGKEVKYVDEEAYEFDDSEIGIPFTSAPTLAEGENILDYIEVTDEDGNEVYVYDAEILNNEIKLMSNEFYRGETYNITVSPGLPLGDNKLGTELKLTPVDVPLEKVDVADVTVNDARTSVTATLQNLETGTGTKDITMIVNITEVQNGNEVSKEVYLKTFSVPYGEDAYQAIHDSISCTSGQKIKVFFADGNGNFGAISNRIFEY